MVPVSLYTFNFGYYGLVVMSLVLFFSKAERLFQFLLRGVSVLYIFASMKVWDVNTGKVIDNRPDIMAPENWYTTAEGWRQHQEDYAIAEEEMRRLQHEIIFREK